MTLAAQRPRRTVSDFVRAFRYRRADWMDRAACARWPGFTEWETHQQQAVCLRLNGGCPVREQCLSFALDGPLIATKGSTVLYGGVPPERLARLQRERRKQARS